MGHNSTIIVMNDALHEIGKDLEFGKKVEDAILELHCGNQVAILSGHHGNAATVIETHHADTTVLLAVGGNCATVLSPWVGGWIHHTDEAKERILRNFADQLGFRVVRKRKKVK